MWDLPGPEIEPMSPALSGGFLTTPPVFKTQPVRIVVTFEEKGRTTIKLLKCQIRVFPWLWQWLHRCVLFVIILLSPDFMCTFCSVYITLQYKYLFKKVLQSWSVDKWKKSSFMQEQGDYFNNNVYSSGKHIPEIKKNPCTGIVLEWVLFMEILLGSWANYVSHTGDL